MKKIMTTGLAVSLFAALGSPVFAEDTGNSQVSPSTFEVRQPLNTETAIENSQDVIESSSNAFTESKVLTFDEMVAVMVKDKGITAEEATNLIVNGGNTASRMTQEAKEAAARLATYRTLSSQINAWTNYKPTLKFYCETSEGGSFHGIVKVLNTSLDRAYNGMSKGFNGTVFIHLEHANKIHFVVDGDFFNNSTSTVGFDMSLGVGEAASIGFNASSTSNQFGYMNYSGDLYW